MELFDRNFVVFSENMDFNTSQVATGIGPENAKNIDLFFPGVSSWYFLIRTHQVRRKCSVNA